jgi:hypothetical protein
MRLVCLGECQRADLHTNIFINSVKIILNVTALPSKNKHSLDLMGTDLPRMKANQLKFKKKSQNMLEIEM